MNKDTVENWLRIHGLSNEIITLGQTTATAQQAADALGCGVSQIAKSLIFTNPQSNLPILIIVSGSNHVNKDKVGDYLGHKIKTASPEFVKEVTGFAPGAVPPFAHKHSLNTLIDADLFKYEVIWAAAGDTYAVFSISPSILAKLTAAETISVC